MRKQIHWKGILAAAGIAVLAAQIGVGQSPPAGWPGSAPAQPIPARSAAVPEAAAAPVVGAISSIVDRPESLAHPAAAGRSVADPHHRVGAAGNFIGFSHADGSGTQKITVLDASKSWMAVYHIDGSGTIRLVSSRPIDADFSLQFNATKPLPEEIRQMERQTRSGGDR